MEATVRARTLDFERRIRDYLEASPFISTGHSQHLRTHISRNLSKVRIGLLFNNLLKTLRISTKLIA